MQKPGEDRPLEALTRVDLTAMAAAYVPTIVPTLLASDGGPSNGFTPLTISETMPTLWGPGEWDVRRLTPRECERLR